MPPLLPLIRPGLPSLPSLPSLVGGAALILLVASPPAWGAEREIYKAAVDRIEEDFLRLEQLDPVEAFVGAAQAAEEAIPWLLVERVDRPELVRVTLSHGASGAFAAVDFQRNGGLSYLPDALGRLEDAIRLQAEKGRGSGQGLGEIDLPVELLRGLARSLDRHSAVLAGERLDAFNERIRGRLVGIGCRIGRQDAGIVLTSVFPDGPAARGGLRSGDVIERIDGVATTALDVEDVVERIRGDVGTTMVLEVRRVGAAEGEQRLKVRLVRDEVRIPNVEWARSAQGVGWIRIDHFSQQTARLVESGMSEMEQQGPLAGLVLDLRGNAGGSMLQSAKVVDLFVDKGVILETGGRGFLPVEGLVQRVDAEPLSSSAAIGRLGRSAPLVVLMDQGSASASEIVAGSLALLDRAVLVGESTHGKGTVQQPFTIGSAARLGGEVKLKLTIAEYRLASQTMIADGVGLLPDVAVDTVTLSRLAMDIPSSVVQGQALGLVREDPGWRGEAPVEERGDLLRELAEEIALESLGPQRRQTLEGAGLVVGRWRADEERRMQEALSARGIDWQREDLCRGDCPAPQVQVELIPLRQPLAGQRVEVEARVKNLGPAPLHRVLVRVGGASSGMPWSGLVIPIGFLPPEEEARGRIEVQLPATLSSRQDLLPVQVEADRRPVVSLPPQLLEVQGNAPPTLVLSLTPTTATPEELARDPLVAVVEATVRNPGGPRLEGLRIRPHQLVESLLEPLDREAVVATLEPGESATVRLAFRWLQPLPADGRVALPLEVRVDRLGTILNAEAGLAWAGAPVVIAPPTLHSDLPLSSPAGSVPVRVMVGDDQQLASVVAWWRGRKVAWKASESSTLALDLELELGQGTQTLLVEATDNQGTLTRRRWMVRGTDQDATAQP